MQSQLRTDPPSLLASLAAVFLVLLAVYLTFLAVAKSANSVFIFFLAGWADSATRTLYIFVCVVLFSGMVAALWSYVRCYSGRHPKFAQERSLQGIVFWSVVTIFLAFFFASYMNLGFVLIGRGVH